MSTIDDVCLDCSASEGLGLSTWVGETSACMAGIGWVAAGTSLGVVALLNMASFVLFVFEFFDVVGTGR